MNNIDLNTILNYALDIAITYGPKLLLAILIFVIGGWVIKRVSNIIDVAMDRAKLAPEIQSFLSSFSDIGLQIALVLACASVLGFQLSSLVAILAAASFAVGMALQGSLGNFAAGIMILGLKPYKVGDWIEVQDKFGQVESIQIFNTTIVTPGQKTLIVPNGQVMEGVITNFSAKEHLRLELNVTMPYSESFPKVKAIILEALEKTDHVLMTPAPEIGIESYDSHSIVIAVRPYIKPEYYWDVTFDSYANIKDLFHKNGIKVAYSEGVELGPIGD